VSNCQNGGYCIVTSTGSASCVCPNGYSGSYCQSYVGGCYSSPCYNGATCTGKSNLGYTCTCASILNS
jgi:hypothetical protein